MLYYLLEFLDNNYDLPGSGLYQYLSFRASLAVILSLFIAIFYGKRIINYLKKKQIGETVRELGLEGQDEKAGTPTMGGIIIIIATLIPVLFFARVDNIYVIMLIVITIWRGNIGCIDDYIKKFRNDKDGLPGKLMVVGQVGLGLIIGATMYFHPDVTVRENLHEDTTTPVVV